MVARSLSIAVAVGFASLVSVGLSPLSAAQAAYPSWSSSVAQPQRAQFRPWGRTERHQPVARWRPQTAVPRAVSRPGNERREVYFGSRQSRRVFDPTGVTRRYAAAKAPLPRPGVRFRPDHREPVRESWGGREEATEWSRSGTQAQFRPADRRRRASYEETQSATRPLARAPAAPYRGYAVPPLAMPPVYGGYWPRW